MPYVGNKSTTFNTFSATDVSVTDDLTVTDDASVGGDLAVTGVATAATFEPDGDTAAGDNAAIGYTAAEGLILTGQGSTSDITLKNDADTTVFTVPTGSDDIKFPDNAKIILGAGNDLQLYHDGTNSYIVDDGSGQLRIDTQGTDVRITKTNSEYMARFITDGAVELYYDNALKLATETGGVNVTGYMDADNFKVNGAQGSDGQVLTSTGSGVGWENAAGGATTLIGTTTLGSNASSISVTGFSTSHDMYMMYFDLRGDQTDGSAKNLFLRVTNDSGTAYTTSFYNSLAVLGTTGPSQNDQNTFRSGNGWYAGGRDDTGNGAWYNGYGVGVMYLFNPKNTTANFTMFGYTFQRADIGADLFSGGIEDIDVDVGGMQWTRQDGGNFEAGSSMTIIGFNRS